MDMLFDVDEIVTEVDEVGQIVKVLQAQEVTDTRGHVIPWPADDAKDRALVRRLLVDYPTFRLPDYEREMPEFAAWMLGLTTKKGINVRARVRTWVSKCNSPRRGAGSHQHGGNARHRGTRAGGAPASADEFGDSRWVQF